MDCKILTQNRLQDLLHYSIISGKFYRNKSRGPCKINSIAGSINKKGYRYIQIDGKRYLAHRLAFLYVMGRFPIDQTDHLNHNRDDNRWLNLRECTHQENGKNRKLGANNTSGAIGVYFYKHYTQKWQVRFKSNYKDILVGYYPTKEEAIQARKQANIDHGFHSNHGQKENQQ